MKKVMNKYKNLSLITKATIWYMICSILQKGISVITTPIFTRLLTTEEYGLYSVYVSWENIFIIFASLRLDYTVFNKGMSKYKNNRKGYVASMQIITTVLSAICLGIYLLFRHQINAFTELSTIVMLLIILQCFVYPSYNFWMLKERYEYRYIRFTLVVAFLTIFNALLGVAAVTNIPGNRGLIRIVTNVLVYFVIGFSLYIINFKNGIKNAKKEHIKFALLFNLPMIPHYLSMYILHQMDRIMIQKMVGMVQTGIYSVASSIGNVMTIISSSFINALTPWYYEKLENNKFDEVKRIFIPVMMSMFILIFSFMLVTPEVMSLFAPKQYYEAIYIIPPVSASIIFQTMYSFFSIPEYYHDANKFSMFASMGSAIANIITNYIFIKIFGYLAAGFTTLLCTFLMALGHYIYAKYIMRKKNMDYFEKKDVTMISLLTMISTIFVCILYNFTILRYTFIIVMLVIIYIKRNFIINTVKKVSKK